MKWRDVLIGRVVYHVSFPHWGKGRIVQRRIKDNLALPTRFKVSVEWEEKQKEGFSQFWMRLSDLRLPPKKAKVK